MRFGAFLPSFWGDYGASSVGVAVAEAARAAVDLRYEGVWVNDVVIMPAVARKPGDATRSVEPLVTLASLVHLAPRVTLGTAVLVLPQRHPVLVAKQTADLHLLSGGRLILGVGIGHRPAEFALLGADYAHRAAATDEGIEILRTLWREPVADYQGRYHRLDGANMERGRPAQGRRSGSGGAAGRRSGGRPGTATAGCPTASTWTASAPAPPRCGRGLGAPVPDGGQRPPPPHRAAGRAGGPLLHDVASANGVRRRRGCRGGVPRRVPARGPGVRALLLHVGRCGRPAATDADLRRADRARFTDAA